MISRVSSPVPDHADTGISMGGRSDPVIVGICAAYLFGRVEFPGVSRAHWQPNVIVQLLLLQHRDRIDGGRSPCRQVTRRGADDRQDQ
jgi:hypothetical protein